MVNILGIEIFYSISIFSFSLLGGGGSGKSHLIRVLAKWLEFILRKPGDHPMKPKVLLLGFTGMAANLIGKTTFIGNELFLTKLLFL